MGVPGKTAMPVEGRGRQMTSQGTGDGDKQECPDDAALKAVDIAGQLGRLLESRRLEPQTVPFQGFRSPPGRF